jgi:hypothetical protein
MGGDDFMGWTAWLGSGGMFTTGAEINNKLHSWSLVSTHWEVLVIWCCVTWTHITGKYT